MKSIYLAIIARLQVAACGVEHISLWNDNIANLEDENGYTFPAVFVEFEPLHWKQGTQGSKSATARINLHIVIESLADPSTGSQYQDEALQVFDTVDNIVDTISGLAGSGFNAMQHIGTTHDHNHDRIQHHIETFTCEVLKYRTDKNPAVLLSTMTIVHPEVK